MTEDVAIHSYVIDKQMCKATIFRKVDMYGTETVCTISLGYGPNTGMEKSYKELNELANALCDYLETKRTNK